VKITSGRGLSHPVPFRPASATRPVRQQAAGRPKIGRSYPGLSVNCAPQRQRVLRPAISFRCAAASRHGV